MYQLKGRYLILVGKDEEGAALLEKALNLRDSVYKADNVSQLMELETIYQTERKNAEIVQLKALNQSQQKVNLLILMSAGTALLALLGLFMYRKEKERKKQLLVEQEQERSEQQLRKKELEELLLKEKLEKAGKQLVNQSLAASENSNFLEDLLAFVNETAANKTMADSQKWQLLQNRLNRKLTGDSEWVQFLKTFEQVNDQFFINLTSAHPDLTLNEKRLCALSKIRMSNKEIAGILHISPDSVKMARYRMKKKMNIPQETDLDDYINSI
jgi:DNA-binding CsgD family transcriptional regulator